MLKFVTEGAMSLFLECRNVLYMKYNCVNVDEKR